MYGQSSVRLVDLQTGSVIREHKMDPTDFGEGLTKLGDTCVLSAPLPVNIPALPVASGGHASALSFSKSHTSISKHYQRWWHRCGVCTSLCVRAASSQ